MRICGDFKVTLNRVTKYDPYPLPKPEDIFATLASGKQYSKIDLAHTYHSIGRSVAEGGSDQHTQEAIPIQQVTIWNSISPCYIPTVNGNHSARGSSCLMTYW